MSREKTSTMRIEREADFFAAYEREFDAPSHSPMVDSSDTPPKHSDLVARQTSLAWGNLSDHRPRAGVYVSSRPGSTARVSGSSHVRAASDAQVLDIKVSTPRAGTVRDNGHGRGDRDLRLLFAHRCIWFFLTMAALTWGILTGLAFAQEDFFISPAEALLGAGAVPALSITTFLLGRK